MKFLPLIWSGIWRKPGRTILIILQIAVAFALFGALQGMKTGVDEAIDAQRADLLIVHSRVSMDDSLPLAYLSRIKSIPGVEMVSLRDVLPSTFQKPTEQVSAVALNPDKQWLSAFPTLRIAPDQIDAFTATRTGALVSVGLAKKYGWKMGDRIPLRSNILQSNGSGSWVFDMIGTFVDTEKLGSDFVIINYNYFDDARQSGKGTVKSFATIISDPKQAAAMSDAIDRQFANSTNETKTESLRELAQSQMQSIGDLNFIIRTIVSAVLLAMLFSIATMMMQAVRERTPELAVLKAVGYTDGAVFILILTEAVVVCIAAAVFGLSLALLAFPFADQFVHGLSMPRIVIEVGLAGSVLVAMISVALPAARAARLDVASALTGRDDAL